MIAERSVDLLYLACNRLEFTRETFTTLLRTTDWRYVNELFVYDDGSIDGAREWLDEHAPRAPAKVRVVHSGFGSPVTAMSHFIAAATAPSILAKTDNDAMLPPAWLRQSLEVLDRRPELALLGIEAMYPHSNDPDLPRDYTPAEFISGLGLYRRSAFAQSHPLQYRKWFGLEEWQVARGPALVRGWITPAIPVFLLDRIPFQPWAGLSDSYIARGWQRSWPKYDAAGALWNWWNPPGAPAIPAPAGDPRFLCAMRVKNEAAHIAEALGSALGLCGRALVFDDHSDDDTAGMCRSFGDRVTVFPSPFQGLNEARDKNFLLERVKQARPDWVLWIDGDEALEARGAEALARLTAARPDASAFALRIAYLWDDAAHVRTDGIFGQFRRPSLFRLMGQRPDAVKFPERGAGPNFHCGNVPEGLQGPVRWCDVRLKHYGYMAAEKRRAKYEWYTTVDPGNAAEDHYRHIAGIPGARFAPGPPRLAPWRDG